MLKPFTSLNRFTTVFITCLLIIFTLDAAAEDADSKLPIEVTADKLVSQDQKGISIYTGNVVIIQGTTEIKGNKVTLHHPNRKLSHAVILGEPATFKRFLPEEQNWINGHAKKITYDAEKKTILLEEDAYVNQKGKNSISGPRILYNTLDKTLHAQGDKANQKRIKVIFEPEESNQKDPS